MKRTIIISAMILLAGCATVKLITPTQADVDRVLSKYPGYSLAELNEGKMNFEHRCTQCHKLKNPASRTEEQWNKIVPRMVQKANKKSEVIDAKTKDSILRYLVTMSAPPKAK